MKNLKFYKGSELFFVQLSYNKFYFEFSKLYNAKLQDWIIFSKIKSCLHYFNPFPITFICMRRHDNLIIYIFSKYHSVTNIIKAQRKINFDFTYKLLLWRNLNTAAKNIDDELTKNSHCRVYMLFMHFQNYVFLFEDQQWNEAKRLTELLLC